MVQDGHTEQLAAHDTEIKALKSGLEELSNLPATMEQYTKQIEDLKQQQTAQKAEVGDLIDNWLTLKTYERESEWKLVEHGTEKHETQNGSNVAQVEASKEDIHHMNEIPDEKHTPSAADKSAKNDEIHGCGNAAGDLENKMDDQAAGVDAPDDRITQLEVNHDTLHNQILEVDKKTEQHDSDITKIIEAQQSHSEKVDSHSTILVHHSESIKELQDKHADYDARIGELVAKKPTIEQHDQLGQLMDTTNLQGEKAARHEVRDGYHISNLKVLKANVDEGKSYGAQISHNTEKLEEDQQKSDLKQHQSQLKDPTDLGQEFGDDSRSLEANNDLINLLQSHIQKDPDQIATQNQKLTSMEETLGGFRTEMAEHKRLVADAQTQHQSSQPQYLAKGAAVKGQPVKGQTATLQTGSDKVAIESSKVSNGGGPKVRLIIGLIGAGIAVFGGASGLYIWLTSRLNSKDRDHKNNGKGKPRPTSAINATAVNVTAERPGRTAGAHRRPEGHRVHAREWKPEM